MAILTAVAIAPAATLCGPVSRDAASAFVVTDEGFEDQRTTLTADAAALVAANPGLDELFGAFADFGGQSACVTFTTDASGVVDSVQLSGVATVCGELEDTSADPDTFIFELSGSTWTPAATISLAGVTIDSSAFGRPALAALEFTSSNQATEPADACFVLDIVASEVVPAMSRVTSIDTAFCGDATEVEADGFWLISVNVASPGRVLVLPEIRGGANLEQAILLTMGGITADFEAPGGCLFLNFSMEGSGQETLVAFLNGTLTFEVVSRSATQIVLRRVSDGAEFGFIISAASDVPACMQPGYRSAGTVDAFSTGQISFTPFSACPEPDAGGGLPDTSASGPLPPVVALTGLALIGLGAAMARRKHLRPSVSWAARTPPRGPHDPWRRCAG